MAKNQIAIEDFTLIESDNRLMDIVNHKASQHNYPRSVDEALSMLFFQAIYGSMHPNGPAVPYQLASGNNERYEEILNYLNEEVGGSSCKDDFYLDYSYIYFENENKLIQELNNIISHKHKLTRLCLTYSRYHCPIFIKAWKHECFMDMNWIINELKAGHLSCVDKWINKNSDFFGIDRLCCSIASAGRLDSLSFLHERG